MTISLPPNLERYIDEQVRKGRFSTPEALVEAAITEMSEWDQDLDSDAIAAINEAEAEGDRGEGIELGAFRGQMMKRFGAP